ncbi:TPA: hypothetical protein DCX15_04520 [bacterium]|nr:hypothetical protein [bacterium]
MGLFLNEDGDEEIFLCKILGNKAKIFSRVDLLFKASKVSRYLQDKFEHHQAPSQDGSSLKLESCPNI